MSSNLLSRIKSVNSDPAVCRVLLENLSESILRLPQKKLKFMEVCGTHTTSIFQSGLHALFPKNLIHISGPGCPVCVTHEEEIALFIQAAQLPDIIIATFGDLIRVPGPDGISLKNVMASGAHIEIVYSPLDALALAKKHPHKEIIFLGVGFETTAPVVGATIIQAHAQHIKNFSVLSFHKLAPQAIKALLQEGVQSSCASNIDGFILPGHVAAIIGMQPFEFIARHYKKPAVIAGFDPADILQALGKLANMLEVGNPQVINTYQRVVPNLGNPQANKIIKEVFTTSDCKWRGLGTIPESGFKISKKYENFDAISKFHLEIPQSKINTACRCGEILKGYLNPKDCKLFNKKCTPASPIGPCMVSSEGTCAAYYKYRL